MPSNCWSPADFNPSAFELALAVERGSIGVADGIVALPLRRCGSGQRATGLKSGRVNGWTFISFEDRHMGDHFWSIDKFGYVRRRLPGGGQMRIHREVMGLPAGTARSSSGLVVDHISRDKTDNRRENLRVVTQAQNTQNQGSRGGTSKYRGVSLCPNGHWYAYGRLAGRMVGLGVHASEDDAAAVARAWRLENLPFATD